MFWGPDDDELTAAAAAPAAAAAAFCAIGKTFACVVDDLSSLRIHDFEIHFSNAIIQVHFNFLILL